jgi:hypothetical protein
MALIGFTMDQYCSACSSYPLRYCPLQHFLSGLRVMPCHRHWMCHVLMMFNAPLLWFVPECHMSTLTCHDGFQTFQFFASFSGSSSSFIVIDRIKEHFMFAENFHLHFFTFCYEDWTWESPRTYRQGLARKCTDLYARLSHPRRPTCTQYVQCVGNVLRVPSRVRLVHFCSWDFWLGAFHGVRVG